MIYFHKILPYFLLPSTLAIILVLAGWLLKRKGITITGACVLVIFSMPITANALFRFLEAGEERMPASQANAADAIVVLSGAGLIERGKSKVIEWNNPNRFFGGVQLYNSGKAPLLVFTGGWLPWDALAHPEGEMLIKQATMMGIPVSSMITTEKVSNTEEEASAVAHILRDRWKKSPGVHGFNSPKVLLVTSAYHMPRAQLLFEKAGLVVVPFPVDFKSSPDSNLSLLSLLPSGGELDRSETAIHELYGRLYYWLKP